LNEKQAASRNLTVLVVLIIIFVVAASVYLTNWYAAPYPGVSVNLDVKIYSSDQNIGVLNEDALFNVTFSNNLNFNQSMRITITAGNVLLKNLSVTLEPETSKNVTFTQKLESLGEWKTKVLRDNETVTSYCFLVVLNDGEANFRINQWNDAQYSKTLATIGAVISVISLTIGIINLLNTLKTSKESKNSIQKPAPSLSAQIIGF